MIVWRFVWRLVWRFVWLWRSYNWVLCPVLFWALYWIWIGFSMLQVAFCIGSKPEASSREFLID